VSDVPEVAAEDVMEDTPEAVATPEPTPEPPARGPWAWLKRSLARIPVPRPKTRRGAIILILITVGVGVVFAVGGSWVANYTESASFCTLCHTMTPQKKAYEASPHASVECGECHVTPGLAGFVSAKLAGTRELYALVTNTYPRPIPPIEHDKLPTADVTCLRCHTLEQITKDSGPSKLVLRTSFDTDEANSRKDLAVLLRPANDGTADARGVHFHVSQALTYTSPDAHEQTIDSVEYRDPKTGELEQFIAVLQVRESISAGRDLERLKATQQVRTMDCRDCHNRVGHAVPTANDAIDASMAAGKIDPSLPYVKRTSLDLVKQQYPSTGAGAEAVDGLSSFYKTKYPLVAKTKSAAIANATAELQRIYTLIDTPEMAVGSMTYPNNIGHQDGPGCFRCHDGAHFKVVKGVVTKEAIPSTCDTCHTFPQFTTAGASQAAPTNQELMSSVPVGARPASHQGSQWVFEHKTAAGTLLPDPNTCGACHKPAYCVNCHASGAIKVDHETMLLHHADSVRESGGTTSCAVCHQPVYCAQCHKGSILGPSNSRLDEPGAGR